MTEYSRENPSPRYVELTELYKRMHVEGEVDLGIPPEQTFPGQSLVAQAGKIKKMIAKTESENILDYGSGKGMLYNISPVVVKGLGEYENILDFWDVDEVYCYDPSYEKFSKLPDNKFDGVICTDVLEHVPEEDAQWIVNEMFSKANKFVFANVASYPAVKHLPNGENAHCTIRDAEWWKQVFATAKDMYDHVIYQVWVQSAIGEGEDRKIVEEPFEG